MSVFVWTQMLCTDGQLLLAEDRQLSCYQQKDKLDELLSVWRTLQTWHGLFGYLQLNLCN